MLRQEVALGRGGVCVRARAVSSHHYLNINSCSHFATDRRNCRIIATFPQNGKNNDCIKKLPTFTHLLLERHILTSYYELSGSSQMNQSAYESGMTDSYVGVLNSLILTDTPWKPHLLWLVLLSWTCAWKMHRHGVLAFMVNWESFKYQCVFNPANIDVSLLYL